MDGRLSALAVDASGGEAYWFLGTLQIIKVSGQHTGGAYALIEAWLPKHAAPPVHTHPQGETFIVLEGDVTAWLDARPHRCGPGSVFYAPPGAPHSFVVESDSARALVLSTPAGIEELFRLLGRPATDRRLPTDEEDPDPEQSKVEAAFSRCKVKAVGPPPAHAR